MESVLKPGSQKDIMKKTEKYSSSLAQKANVILSVTKHRAILRFRIFYEFLESLCKSLESRFYVDVLLRSR